MRVVILGCGRVGARLAGMLDADQHQVSIIDGALEAFERLPRNFGGKVVLGEGIDCDIMKQAGIAKASVFCALSNNDNTNIMASQVAKEIFHVKRVITRIYDPSRQKTYRELGLETVCPTKMGVSHIESLLGIE